MSTNQYYNRTHAELTQHVYDRLKEGLFDRVLKFVSFERKANKLYITINPKVGETVKLYDEEGFLIPSTTAQYVCLETHDETDKLKELAYIGFMRSVGVDKGDLGHYLGDRLRTDILQDNRDNSSLRDFFKEEMPRLRCLALLKHNEFRLLRMLADGCKGKTGLPTPDIRIKQLDKGKVNALLG